MFIEIKEDIIKDAIDKKNQDVNESKDLLILMALCARLGKHIVSVKCLLTNSVLRKELIEIIGKDYFSSLDYFNTKRVGFGAIISHLSVKCIITYERSNEVDDSIIWIIPNEHKIFEPWVETHVLTENLADSSFYIHLAYYYLNNFIHLCGSGRLPISFCYYPLMGGGVTIDKVLKGEIERQQNFCFILADSDKKWPEATAFGETAQNMIDLMDKYTPFNCRLYVMNYVREIENLIPQKLVEAYGDATGFLDIFNLDPSFFDMKVGLRLGELYDDSVCLYWKNMLHDDALFLVRDEILHHNQNKKKYDSAIKGKEPLKKGFGNGLLSWVIEDIDYSTEIRKFKPKMKNQLYQIKPENLTPAQQKEWKKIGQLMFSWTCCIKQRC